MFKVICHYWQLMHAVQWAWRCGVVNAGCSKLHHASGMDLAILANAVGGGWGRQTGGKRTKAGSG